LFHLSKECRVPDHRLAPRSTLVSAHPSRRTLLARLGIGAAALVVRPHLSIAAQDASPDACADAAPDDLIASASAFFTEGLAAGNFDIIDEIYASDGTHNAAFFPVAPDLQTIKDLLAGLRTAFPDITVTIDEAFTDGEFVVIRWTDSGTFSEPIQGFAPTGAYVSWSGMNIFQFRCGQIIESWAESDTLTQLGLNLDPDAPIPATPAIVASPSASCVETTEQDNIDLAVAWFDILNSKDVTLYNDLVSPDTIHHFGLRRDAVGLNALQEAIGTFFTAFPDLTHVDEQIIASDDLVAIRYTNSGTFDGPFLGAEPTGATVTWTGINIFRIACGKVVESWSENAGLHLWRQLGIVPPAATPAA
jgi:predicted ester cyclase